MRSRVLLPTALALGVFLGAMGGSFFLSVTPASLLRDGCGAEYALINPWIRCEPETNIQKKKEFSEFKAVLQNQLDTWTTEGRIAHVSVYLRDLQFGPWMGINEDEVYSAASLLKLPVLFAVLKQAEHHTDLLGQRVQVPEEFMEFVQEFEPERSVQAGGVYTVDELLEYMIVYSDNNAKNALDTYLAMLHPEEVLLQTTMEELGFAGVFRSFDDALNVKQVSSMFRILYNASYLNKDMTEKALELLTRSDFTDGLVAGVPSGTVVAHKFGEREYDNGEKQLHDCGIVYYPKDNYLLCVMTRGRDEVQLASVIADISRTIYTEMEARNTKE